MFLRWTKYTDTAGNTRLYASLLHSVRDGKIVRHKNKGSLHILGLRQNYKHPLQTRRVLWAGLDRALKKFRSPPKSANARNEKRQARSDRLLRRRHEEDWQGSRHHRCFG
jgi:hypothetical protein